MSVSHPPLPCAKSKVCSTVGIGGGLGVSPPPDPPQPTKHDKTAKPKIVTSELCMGANLR
jgi:hypothetical protein